MKCSQRYCRTSIVLSFVSWSLGQYSTVLFSILALSISAHGDSPASGAFNNNHGASVSSHVIALTDMTLLGSVKLGAGHSLEVMELSDGDVALLEYSEIDRHSQVVTPEVLEAGGSLEGVLRLVAPEMAASLRNVAALQVPVTLTSSQRTMDTTLAPPIACPINPDGSDVDYWVSWECDAIWFMKNFCPEGNRSNTWCTTNTGWSRSPIVSRSWIQATGMNAAFEGVAVLRMQYKGPWYDPNWFNNGAYVLDPRKVLTVTTSGNKKKRRARVYGGYRDKWGYPRETGNGRVHLAVRW